MEQHDLESKSSDTEWNETPAHPEYPSKTKVKIKSNIELLQDFVKLRSKKCVVVQMKVIQDVPLVKLKWKLKLQKHSDMKN